MTTEAQMVLEAIKDQNVQTFIGLLAGLGPDDVKSAVEEITEELS
jgi:hypothetical protein